MRRFWSVALILAVCLLTPLAARAEIEVSAPGQQTIPLAVTAFLPLDEVRPEVAAAVGSALDSDLGLSGLFSFIDPAAFLGDASKLGLLSIDVDFGQWRLLGAEDLVKGAYSVRGDQLVLEARLFDVVGRRLLVGRRYVGRVKDARRMAHAFADDILKSLTGTEGPFNARIAFVNDRSGHKELYLMDVDGSNLLQLTDHRSIVLNPDFSPRGKELIFTSYRRGNPDLYRKEIFTGKETRISARKGLNIGGRYRRPDGQAIALTLSKDGNAEIYQIDLSGRIEKRLTHSWGIDVDPSWSPDGKAIAFVSDRQGNPQVFIADADGGDVHRLTLDGKYNATPAWSPKGDLIAFSRLDGGRFDIYTIHPDGSGERRLTFGPGSKEHPRWSPDGRFLVYSSDQDGSKAIYVMRADGTGNRRISPAGGQSSHPAWSPRW